MSKSSEHRRKKPGSWPKTLRLRPIAAACSGLFFVASTSYAQEAPPAAAGNTDAVETVVVTGIKHSIESSIATKRNSNSIVEAVSAEDIGKLPDVSIAEALSRLPGLAAQNVDGRAQTLNIRGMSPDFAGTLLNGREQTTTGTNRGVEFDQYPAELLSSATVYKTPDATLLGQGLSGTIDMHTIRPLDISEKKIAANVRGEINSQGDQNNGNGGTSNKGGRFSVSYIDQFADRTLGLALGFAHMDAPSQEKQFQIWGYNQQSICAANCASWGSGISPGLPADSTYASGFQVETISRDEKRDGLMATLEYKPSKDLHSTVDLFYSKFNQTEVMTGLMGNLGDWANGAPNAYNPSTLVINPMGGYNVVQTADITLGNLVVRNDYNTRDDKIFSLGWNTEAKLADWKAIADLSYSTAKRTEVLFETYAGSKSSTNMTFDIGTLSSPGSIVTNVSYGNPSNMFLGAGSAGYAGGNFGKKQITDTNDVIKALNLHAKHDLKGIFSEIDTGVDYSKRDKTSEFHVYNAVLNGPTTTVQGHPSIAIPAGLNSTVNVAGLNVLSYNPYSLASLYTFQDVTGNQGFGTVGGSSSSGGAVSGDLTHDFGVHEKITTAYAKADIETDLGNIPLHGNLGAQLIHTDQSSNALQFAGSQIVPYTAGTTYNDFLPSLNLVGDIGNNKVRFGLAKTLARPRIDDLNASNNANVSSSSPYLWSGGGGNPKLKPWRATSVDLSLEHYYGKRSYVAGALFYKKLQSYIYSQSIQNYDFSTGGYVNTSNNTPISNLGSFTQPVNGTGGNMKGFELAGSLDWAALTNSLDGFGTQASYTQTSSSVEVNGPGGGTPIDATLPGLSKYTMGLTMFYEKYGFSARINDRYRSAFRAEYAYLFGQTSVLSHLSQNTVDLQLGYEFQEGKGKGLGLTLQVINLTNAPDRIATSFLNGSNQPGTAAPMEYDTFGRSLLLGLNYKM